MDATSADLLRKRLERERLARKQAEAIIEAKSRELFTKNQELEEKNRELFELNRLKNRFLGIAAHDLRTPLGSIQGFSRLLLSDTTGPLTETQRDFVATIAGVSEEMLRLLNDLLDVSAIESGRLELRLERTSLRRLLEARIARDRVIADRKGITIATSLGESPDALVDPHRINQVIDNLVSNAIKFSPAGSRIGLTLSSGGRHALVRVSDQGPGVSEADRERMFGEFQRLSAAPTGGEKSTGLGLSIVKKIIDAHGGSITVESTPGSGATFVVALPVAES